MRSLRSPDRPFGRPLLWALGAQVNPKNKSRASLEEILQSTSDTLFPAELGKAPVSIHSKDFDGDTPLHVVVRRKDRYAVSLLIEAGADIDARGDMTETPLHVAVQQGDISIIEALLQAGAKTDIRSEFDQTPAEYASQKGWDIAKLFQQHAGT